MRSDIETESVDVGEIEREREIIKDAEGSPDE